MHHLPTPYRRCGRWVSSRQARGGHWWVRRRLTNHHLTNTTPLAAHRTRGFASSHFSPSGAERRGPYRSKFGDAALAAPRTTTGLPAASPRSSTPGGEPAYAYRRQQTWHGFADVSCPIVAPGPDRRQPALACALGGQIRDEHRIRSRPRAGIDPRAIRIAALIFPPSPSPHTNAEHGFATR
jgi:hypothetical protein